MKAIRSTNRDLPNLADFKDSAGLLGQRPLECPAGTRQGEDRTFNSGVHEQYIASLYRFFSNKRKKKAFKCKHPNLYMLHAIFFFIIAVTANNDIIYSDKE